MGQGVLKLGWGSYVGRLKKVGRTEGMQRKETMAGASLRQVGIIQQGRLLGGFGGDSIGVSEAPTSNGHGD